MDEIYIIPMQKNSIEPVTRIVSVPVSDLRVDPSNPRIIKDDRFEALVKSVREFPQMLEKRPLIVDSNMVVIGGNMRLRAAIQAGLEQVPVIVADDWSPEQMREFTIKDNVSFGMWDLEELSANWDSELLVDWGLDMSDLERMDFTEQNREVRVEGFEKEMELKLKYSEDDYFRVVEALSNVADTPELAVLSLIENA